MECVIQCREGALMDPIGMEDSVESRKTHDGTKKWYKCRECGNTFILDKMTRSWEYTPDTYTHLVSIGVIKDYLD